MYSLHEPSSSLSLSRAATEAAALSAIATTLVIAATMSASSENSTIVYCGQGLDDFHTR